MPILKSGAVIDDARDIAGDLFRHCIPRRVLIFNYRGFNQHEMVNLIYRRKVSTERCRGILG